MATTYPAQTPVAWSTFATGLNPGAHGIFDFLKRDPNTYLPQLGLNTYEQKSSFLPPKAVNLRSGTPIWSHLTRAGMRSAVLRCPCTYPPDKLKGSMLSGLGVPDLRGSLGIPTFFTTDANAEELESESLVTIGANADGKYETHLLGPRDPKTGEPVRFPLLVERRGEALAIHSEGKPNEVLVQPGTWSEWLRVKFKMGFLQGSRGMVRFYVHRVSDDLEFYASPINFDPDMPLFPISTFHEYASDLAGEIGHYYTTGMVEEHTGLINGRIDENAFLRQCDDVWREREAMLFHELGRMKDGFLFCLFDTPDRLQHMFWRFREPDHPANAKHPGGDFANVIDEEYQRCDNAVGKLLDQIDDTTLLITLSDHGFNSFRRGMHVNTWLHDQGLLKLKGGAKPGGEESGDFFRNVDWSQTQAYALGLGGIYLNVAGREHEGIVAADEAPALKAKLKEQLSQWKDAEQNAVAVNSVVAAEEIYQGEHVKDAPDLLVNFAAGYRASWDTALGGIPEGHFEDNTKRWAGDHIIDPSLVPGILFMNTSFDQRTPRLLDMAPTILSALGAPGSETMSGDSLL